MKLHRKFKSKKQILKFYWKHSKYRHLKRRSLKRRRIFDLSNLLVTGKFDLITADDKVALKSVGGCFAYYIGNCRHKYDSTSKQTGESSCK